MNSEALALHNRYLSVSDQRCDEEGKCEKEQSSWRWFGGGAMHPKEGHALKTRNMNHSTSGSPCGTLVTPVLAVPTLVSLHTHPIVLYFLTASPSCHATVYLQQQGCRDTGVRGVRAQAPAMGLLPSVR